MRLPKRIVIFAAAGLIGGAGSYGLGFSGFDPARALTDSRCRAGAYIAHANVPKDLGSDAAPVAAVTQTDPASTVTHPVAATGINPVSNPGAEAMSGNNPQGWAGTRIGNNDAAFSQVAGHNSGRGLRIDITKYTDGTADWTSGQIKVTPGAYYAFSDYYRANVPTHGTLALKDDQGQTNIISLIDAPLSTNWSAYSVRFFVPLNVHEVSVSHTLDALGSLETDDYSLVPSAPGGFNEPLVSVTFDDGRKSVHEAALPIMKRYDVVSTQYIVSGFLGRSGYIKPGQVYDFVSAGHEVAAHSYDHRDLTTLKDKELGRELTLPRDGLSKCYGTTTDFATPYGTYNPHVTSAIKSNYQTSRTTDAGLNSADQFNPYELKAETVRADTTPEQIQAWINTAKANRVWLILVYHQIDDSNSEFARTPADFESDLQKLVASGVAIKTVHDAYAEIKPQIKP
jgi:peptidoglycan/xylan/chitin deacetylase (PgdA/CDA1 family)